MFAPDKAKRKNEDKPKGRLSWLTPGRHLALTLLAALLMGVLIVVSLRPAPLANSHFPTSRLAYTSDGQRYALNLQTGDRTPSYPVPDPADIPHLSPDSKWVVFWRPDYDRDSKYWNLFVQETQKPETQRVIGTFIGPVSGLSWSGDNDHIVFSAHFDFERPGYCRCDEEIFMVSRVTGKIKRLTDNTHFDSDPVFSPDGTQIVYTSALVNDDRLYIMDIATENWRALAPDLYGYMPMPQWSPDGEWIAFKTTAFDPNGDIWIVRPDGRDAQSIISGPAVDMQPEWIP